MTQRLPLFPLGTVLVPGEVLPLHVFEPRYLDLVEDLLQGAGDVPGRPGGARFGVVAIRQGHEVGADRLGALHDVGCAAEVLEVRRDDDGSVELVAVGRERFRLDQLDPDAGTRYLTGLVEWVDEPADPVDPALAAEVRSEFAAYCERLGLGTGVEETLGGADADGGAIGAATTDEPRASDGPSGSALDDPTLLSYVVTGSMLLHLPERQGLLAARDATARLRRALGLLTRERTLWQVAPSVPAVDLARVPADPR